MVRAVVLITAMSVLITLGLGVVVMALIALDRAVMWMAGL